MTFETNNSTAKSEKLADDAVMAYQVARDVFLARIEALKTAPVEDDGKDVQSMLMQLSRMISTAVDHTQRIEDDKSKSNGGMSNGAYDLEEARAEIGVRLACIRDASDAGGLSEGAD